MKDKPKSSGTAKFADGFSADLKRVIGVGVFTFTLKLIFSLFFYKERLMLDGAYMVFEMCNTGSFPLAQNRYIIWLLDFLPVAAVNLGLPLKAVIVSWSLNYFLFYLCCFLVVTFLFKDATAGWVVITLHSFTTASDYFNMANEMLPGAILIVVLFLVIKNRPTARGVILILLFFVAFAHLLVLMSLLMVSVYAAAIYTTQALKFVRQNKWWLGVFAAFALARIVLAYLEPYENERLSPSENIIAVLSGHLTTQYIIATVTFFITVFPLASVFGVLLISYLLSKKMWWQLLWVQAILLGYTLIWLLYLNPEGTYRLNSLDHVAIRYLFPALYFMIVAFFMHFKWQQGQLRLILPFTVLCLVGIRFALIYNWSTNAVNTVKQFETIIDYAHKSNKHKVFVSATLTCPNVYKADFYAASIIYSSLKDNDSTVHVIIPQHNEEIALITAVEKDQFYQSADAIYPQGQLNEQYFNLQEEEYDTLNIAAIDCGQPHDWN